MPAAETGSLGPAESPFEEAVAAAFRARGWEVRTQIGVSGFRIDLAVVNPDRAGAYLAGIECDGATYHSSATARDRDKVRQSVLEGLGWNILRIWSTDWFRDSSAVTDRLSAQLDGLLAEFRERQAENRADAETEPETPALPPRLPAPKNSSADPETSRALPAPGSTQEPIFAAAPAMAAPKAPDRPKMADSAHRPVQDEIHSELLAASRKLVSLYVNRGISSFPGILATLTKRDDFPLNLMGGPLCVAYAELRDQMERRHEDLADMTAGGAAELAKELEPFRTAT